MRFMGKRLFANIYRFRWAIAAAILALCVIFELSGSSIGALVATMGGADESLIGAARIARSDEYIVFTPMALSQCVADGGSFSYFQDAFRGTDTDMFCVYGQPVWDIAVLFRPFQIGYLLLGAERGLSFFWCARLIVLFMVSFEFGNQLLTKDRRGLAFVYALFIALAPQVQWWFSTNALVEMLIFGQIALLFLGRYLDTSSYGKRFLYALGIGWCLAVFVLALYPAWQIPLGYVFLVLLISLLAERLPGSWKGMKDILLCLFVIAFVIAAVGYVAIRSWDTIQAVLHTVYPGQRNATGGGMWKFLFDYPLWIIAPFTDSGMDVAGNVCEGASFFTAFPLSFLLPVCLMVKRGKVNLLWVLLLLIAALFGIYEVVGLPDPIAKVTLLGKSTPDRADIGCTLALVLLFFSTLKRASELSSKERIILVFVSVVVLALGLLLCHASVRLRYQAVLILLVMAFFVCALFIDRLWGSRAFLIIGTVIAFASGALVNPVVSGLSGYYETSAAKMVRAHDGEDEKWAVIGDKWVAPDRAPSLEDDWVTSDYLAGLGASTITSTNAYPQVDTWRSIAEDPEAENVYNRYAHITFRLKDSGDTVFDLGSSPDTFNVTLTPDDLKTLGVTRLFSDDPDLERFSSDSISIERLDDDDSYYVYALR